MFHGPLRGIRPRHPLTRLLAGALGVIVMLALLAIGMFALAVLAFGGGLLLLVKALRSAQRPPAGRAGTKSPGIIEGEFTIVAEPRARDASAARS